MKGKNQTSKPNLFTIINIIYLVRYSHISFPTCYKHYLATTNRLTNLTKEEEKEKNVPVALIDFNLQPILQVKLTWKNCTDTNKMYLQVCSMLGHT